MFLPSQIAIGLRTDNIVAWNVWENDNGNLKHCLYIYNRTSKEIKVEIKLKKYKDVDERFKEIITNKILYTIHLAANQLNKLDYPENFEQNEYMEFFEQNAKIGLMPFNSDKPDKSFVKNAYKIYSNSVFNSGSALLWMRFESIFEPSGEMGISTNITQKKDYYLVKFLNSKSEGEPYWTKLNDFKETDKSIIRIGKAKNSYILRLNRNFGQEKIVFIAIMAEYIQEGRMVAAQNWEVPIFKVR